MRALILAICALAHIWSQLAWPTKEMLSFCAPSDRVGEVWLFAEINKECVALISFWSFLEKKATHSIWNMQEQPELVHTAEIMCPLTYRKLEDGKAIVLLPLECR